MIVLSDMNGTLTTGSPYLGVVDWVKHNQNNIEATWYKLSIIPSYFLATRGLIDWQAWGQKLMVDCLGYIRNATPEKVTQVSEWLVEQELWKKRREDVVARLIKHREEGARTYIASSMMEPFLEPFARRIGAEVIGTPTEIVDGRLKIAGEMVVNEKKIEQALSRLGVDKVDVAYGDSLMDVPMLEHADHPVAVYPEEGLKKLAQERGWEILGDTGWYE